MSKYPHERRNCGIDPGERGVPLPRVAAVFEKLVQLPGARKGLDLPGLARGMDALFWSLLGQAVRMPNPELERWVESCTHLIYHALFTDAPKMERGGTS